MTRCLVEKTVMMWCMFSVMAATVQASASVQGRARRRQEEVRQRTDEDDVVVELVLALALRALPLAVHLGHLLQAVEDGRDDALVVTVDDLADVERVGAVELRLDARDEELGATTTSVSMQLAPRLS